MNLNMWLGRDAHRARVNRARSLAVAVGLALASTANAQTPSFTVIPWAPGAGSSSVPADVSGDGSVVAGTSWSAADGHRLFRWTKDGGFSFINRPDGWLQYNDVRLSHDGSTIVGSASIAGNPATRGFRWRQSTGHSLLDPVPGEDITSATGVSADGDLVVGHSNKSTSYSAAVRWNAAGQVERLGEPGNGQFLQHRATAVSLDGSVVVGVGETFATSQAVRWTQDTGFTGLGWLEAGDISSPVAVSADGTAIAGWSTIEPYDANPNPSFRPFRWTSGTGMVQLEAAGDSYATDMSGDGGFIVGGSFDGAVLWDPSNHAVLIEHLLGSVLGLNLNGVHLASATAISSDGSTIVGVGYDPSGVEVGWIATIPGPAAWSIILVPVGSSARRRR